MVAFMSQILSKDYYDEFSLNSSQGFNTTIGSKLSEATVKSKGGQNPSRRDDRKNYQVGLIFKLDKEDKVKLEKQEKQIVRELSGLDSSQKEIQKPMI